VAVPAAAELLLDTSGTAHLEDGVLDLPADTAVWFRG
jgi:hypothetical protein